MQEDTAEAGIGGCLLTFLIWRLTPHCSLTVSYTHKNIVSHYLLLLLSITVYTTMNPTTILKPAVKSAAMLSSRSKLSSTARGTSCYLPTCSDSYYASYTSSSTMNSDTDMSLSFQHLSLASLQEPSSLGFLSSSQPQLGGEQQQTDEWGFFVNVDPAAPTASGQQPNTIFQRFRQKEAAALSSSSSSSSSMGWPSVPL